jgi:hypothetical protein
MSLFDALLGNYKTVSARLGLTIEDGRIHGVVDGVPIQVWFGPHATHIAALLTRPAPIDLSIATKGLIGKLGELFGGHHDGIGDDVFDRAFSLKASNPSSVAALLSPDARRALLDAEKAGLHPAVDAHSLHLRRFSQGGLADSEQMIDGDLRTAARLARVVGESFGRT